MNISESDFDNMFCPLIRDRCEGRVCVCFHFSDIGASKEDWQATCSHFKCKLGKNLQPKKKTKVSPITSVQDLEAEA